MPERPVSLRVVSETPHPFAAVLVPAFETRHQARMRCSNCGFENDAGAANCLNCGAELTSAAVTAEVKPPRPVVAKPRDSGRIPEIDTDQPIETDEPIDPAEGGVPGPVSAPPEPGFAIPTFQPEVAPGGDNQISPGQVQPSPYGQGEVTAADPTIQEPAAAQFGDSFTAGTPHDTAKNQWIFAVIALFLGIAIGALATYLLIPASEYLVIDGSPDPTPSASAPMPPGVLVIPVPRGKAGPIVPPGPDAAAMQSLRNALIGQNRYYLSKGNFTDNTDELGVISPEVAWEAGFTPSRAGVVTVGLCGPAEPSTAVLLQSVGGSGKTYAVIDQPTGPSAGVYYAMSAAAFQCPNSIPPASPWMRTLEGWGISQVVASSSPSPTTRDDRNDPVPPPYVPPTAQPTATSTPRSTSTTSPGATTFPTQPS